MSFTEKELYIHRCHVEALKTGKVTLEEAFKFNNSAQVDAPKLAVYLSPMRLNLR